MYSRISLRNYFKQRVNFFISTCFIAVFGLFLTMKVLDILQMFDPITENVAATQVALNLY